MSQRSTPFTESEEDALFAFGDAISGGRRAEPRSELEAVALRVHRALRMPAPQQSTMPRALKADIWEEIMQSTASTTLGAAPGRRTMEPVARHRPLATLPRNAWMAAANLGLVLLIALAGFAAWRAAGDGERPISNPGIALQASTPDAATLTPAASGSALSDCDLRGDIPIIPEIAEGQTLPDATYLALVQVDRMKINNPRADLVLGCADEERVLLAENVVTAGPGPWPGVVSLSILPPASDDLATSEQAYLDLATGAMFVAHIARDEARATVGQVDGSPWLIAAAASDPDVLLITDLRSMESRPFSEVAGVDAPADAPFFLSSPSGVGAIAIGFAHPYEGNALGGTLLSELDAPGDLLLLGDSFADARWLSLPESLPRIGAVSLSPDGAYAAVTSLGEGDVIADSYTYALLDLAGGEVIAASTEIPYDASPFVVWVGGGDAIAYLAGSTVQTLSIAGDGGAESVFDAGSQLSRLQTTWDPNVVVAATAIDRGSDAGEPTGQDMVYSVNVATGETHEFAGVDASGVVGWITDAGALVMYEWSDTIVDQTTYQVYDPVTGDLIGTIADAPSAQHFDRMRPTLGIRSVGVSADGSVEVIAFGTSQIFAFVRGAEGLQMQRVASPDGMLSSGFLTADLIVSPDGSQLALFGQEDEGRTRYITSLIDPDAGWTVIENTIVAESGSGPVNFVRGLGD